MQRLVTAYGEAWSAPGAVFSNAALDYAQYVSATSHPALIAARAVATTVTETGAQAVGGTQPAAAGMPSISQSNTQGAGSAAWAQLGTGLSPLGYTTQAGDELAFTTASGTYQVAIQLAGLLTAGMGAEAGEGLTAGSIRNGAVAAILVDGTTVATLDTYNAAPALTLYLDGVAHTVAIVHSGGYNGAIGPIGPVVAGTGTSVAHNLSPTAVYHPTFVSATWRVKATGSTAYSLYKTPQGGSESLVQAGLATGTHYTGASYVPGADLYVGTGTALTTNDDAHFVTDVLMLVVGSIAYGTGTGGGASMWTSPVLDLGDPAAQMVAAEMQQGTPLLSVQAASGQTAVPDGTWTTASAVLGGCTTSDGTQWGTAGLLGAVPPGRYGQVTLTLAGVGLVQPWVRDLAVYAWNPARDSVGGRLVLHAHQVLGPSLAAYLAALATWYADVRQDLLDLRAAGSIGGAVDAYLQGYMDELGLGWVTGEPKEAARARARGVLSNAGGALSIVGIAQQVDLLVNGLLAPVTVAGAAGSWVASCGGVVVSQTGSMGYSVLIPAAPYAGLPGLAVSPSTSPGTANAIVKAHITTTLRPVGASASVTFTTGS